MANKMKVSEKHYYHNRTNSPLISMVFSVISSHMTVWYVTEEHHKISQEVQEEKKFTLLITFFLGIYY